MHYSSKYSYTKLVKLLRMPSGLNNYDYMMVNLKYLVLCYILYRDFIRNTLFIIISATMHLSFACNIWQYKCVLCF